MAKKRITPQEAQERLQELLEAQDDRRAPALEGLLRVRKARGRALERGVRRRTARRGEHAPGVTRLVGRLERNRLAREELRPLRTLARQPAPTVDEATWTVRGLVLSADNRGVEGATVQLVDGTGKKLRNSPTATTDADGSYELKVPVTANVERQVFVEVQAGAKRKRLTERPLTMNAGAIELVVGHGIGVKREPVIDTRFKPAKRVRRRPGPVEGPGGRKAPAKKSPAKKTVVKKSPGKKSPVKKSPGKKTVAKRSGAKKPRSAAKPKAKMAVPKKSAKKVRKRPKRKGARGKKGGAKKRRK